VGVKICVVGCGESVEGEHPVGWERLVLEKQVDASSCPVFFVEDARTSRIKSFGHTKLDGAPAMQHPGWTCRTTVSAQRLTLPLSLDKSFGEYFQGQGWHLTRLIGWTSRPVNTRFFEPRHFFLYTKQIVAQPLKRISGKQTKGDFQRESWRAKWQHNIQPTFRSRRAITSKLSSSWSCLLSF
jgi:hypothetical protein